MYTYLIVDSRRAPTAHIEPHQVTVAEGSSQVLTCIVSGEPTPTVEWSRRSGELTTNHRISGTRLTILSASDIDRDMYQCTASNVVGKYTAMSSVDVERKLLMSLFFHIIIIMIIITLLLTSKSVTMTPNKGYSVAFI